MNLDVEVPDDLVGPLSVAGGGRITKTELRHLLGFNDRDELDGFLKAHDVWIDYSLNGFLGELQDLKRLGF